MKRVLTYVLVLLIPLSFLLNGLQAFAFQDLSRSLEAQDLEQRDLFEQNRRLMTELSTITSPAMVLERGLNLGMRLPLPGETIIIQVETP